MGTRWVDALPLLLVLPHLFWTVFLILFLLLLLLSVGLFVGFEAPAALETRYVH